MTPSIAPRDAGILFVMAYVIGLVMLMTAGIYDGPLAEPSILLVVLCFVAAAVLFVRVVLGKAPSSLLARVSTQESRTWLFTLLAGLGVFAIATFADKRLLIHGPNPVQVIRVVEILQLGLLATYAPAILRGKRETAAWTHVRFACFAAMLVAGGISVIYTSPRPEVDVWQLHTQAAQALLRGENMYVLDSVHVGDQGRPGMPLIAFPYPPTPCYINAVAYALGGDVRWGMLTALLTAGIVMRRIAGGDGARAPSLPSLAEDAPALLLWMTPKAFFFLEISWNDSYPLALVSLAVLAHASGRRRLSAFFLGVTLSAKQTMIWFLPLAVLLGFSLVEWAIFLGTAAAAVVPFVLWDFRAFKHSTIDLFLGYTARTIALGPMAYLTRHFGIVQGKAPPGPILAAVSTALILWRGARNRYVFAVGAMWAVFSFYLFNKFILMNYYFFIMGLTLLAGAVALGERERARE